MKKVFRWLIVSWFVLYSALFNPLAYAASAGGWAFSAFDVATSVVTAMKNGGTAAVAVAKSPISQKIGKGILGGAIVGLAIPLAISQITGIALDAVTWVLDPANNAIKYSAPGAQATYNGKTLATYTVSLSNFSSAEAEKLCRDVYAKNNFSSGYWYANLQSLDANGNRSIWCNLENGSIFKIALTANKGSIPIKALSQFLQSLIKSMITQKQTLKASLSLMTQ